MLGLVLCLCVDLSAGCSAHLGNVEPAASDLIGALSCTLSVLPFGMVNAVAESFFKTVKVERVDRLRYLTRAQARLDIIDWMEGFYNRFRLHSSIGCQTPVAKESSFLAA